MLDIKFIRENKEVIQEAAKSKRIEINIDDLLKKDDERKTLIQSSEVLKSEQNEMSRLISVESDPVKRSQMIEDMKGVKAKFVELDEELKVVMKDWQTLMLQVPNIPNMSVPQGKGEEDNISVRQWGEKKNFEFTPLDHIELMLRHDMVDFERGTKVHGFRGYFMKNDGAELMWAVWNYARQFFGKRNFTSFVAPAVLKKQFFYATGHLPNEAEDLYFTQDGDYLSGTAEVAMMAYHADEILTKEELPKRYLAFSPCYRREAGSHGKDTKGLIRVQEFYKIEQLVLSEANHRISEEIHEELNRNFEEFLESMEIPYQRLLICTGDLSASKVKQYDTEAWFPSQSKYRELSSASYFHDFQTRRFNIRYEDEGKKSYTHSANCTAAATPRIIAAIVENYQNADGTITIPQVLVPFMGKNVIGSAS